MVKNISNDTLAVLLIAVMVISIVGTVMVLSKLSAPVEEAAPVTEATQTGQVSLYVQPSESTTEGKVALTVVEEPEG